MNRTRFNTLISLPVIFLLISLPLAAYAQVDPVTDAECNKLGIKCIGGSFNAIATVLLTALFSVLALVGVVAFAALVYSGFLYVTSRGDEEQARRAKTGIVYALVGLVIIGISGWLVNATINL